MKPFMDQDFLLQSPTAQKLYHEHAAKMPVVDYHCHINPAEIADDRRFDNLAQAWLGGDHYKWRLMRACGVDERLITGDASDWEKFEAFAAVMPGAIGNPVYHWCHLELRRYFDCDLPLSAATARPIWDACNQKLADPAFSVRGLIAQSKVTTIVTTDDPADDLRHHRALAADASFTPAVYPGWRPDKLMNIEQAGFSGYLEALAAAAGSAPLTSLEAVKAALVYRMDFFHNCGCRASDHGLEAIVNAPATGAEVEAILQKRLSGGAVSKAEGHAFRWALLLFLGAEYAKRGWVMELHFAATRNNNTRAFERLGPDTGYDAISNADCMPGLSALLDALEQKDALPKTMLFSLNPNDNAAIASTMGCFQGGSAGKLQHGTAWWFNDTKTGMEQQLINLANMSVLGNFAGMLTDSRSFLSYTRHEYFRRILCNLLGTWVENGEYPPDPDALGALIENVSYHNAMRYFGFDILQKQA